MEPPEAEFECELCETQVGSEDDLYYNDSKYVCDECNKELDKLANELHNEALIEQMQNEDAEMEELRDAELTRERLKEDDYEY